MESYSALAASYDELTQDVGYEKRAAFVEKLFLRSHIPVHTVLDLACGTGTMTALLTERGYELIGVDGSSKMAEVGTGSRTPVAWRRRFARAL